MNLQKLKNKIIEAVPEILKPCDGCIKSSGWKLPAIEGDEVVCDRCNGSGYIQGRPIRLADVLLAISKNHKWEKDIIDNFLTLYNLKDDNLDHQSDETKQFLTNLLTKKGE